MMIELTLFESFVREGQPIRKVLINSTAVKAVYLLEQSQTKVTAEEKAKQHPETGAVLREKLIVTFIMLVSETSDYSGGLFVQESYSQVKEALR